MSAHRVPLAQDGRDEVIRDAWCRWFGRTFADMRNADPTFTQYQLERAIGKQTPRARIRAWLAGKEGVGAEVAFRVGAALYERTSASRALGSRCILSSGPVALAASQRFLELMTFLSRLALAGPQGARHAVALYRLLPAYTRPTYRPDVRVRVSVQQDDGTWRDSKPIIEPPLVDAYLQLLALHREPGANERYAIAFKERSKPRPHGLPPATRGLYDSARSRVAAAQNDLAEARRNETSIDAVVAYGESAESARAGWDWWAKRVDPAAFAEFAPVDLMHRLLFAVAPFVQDDADREMRERARATRDTRSSTTHSAAVQHGRV